MLRARAFNTEQIHSGAFVRIHEAAFADFGNACGHFGDIVHELHGQPDINASPEDRLVFDFGGATQNGPCSDFSAHPL